MVVLAIYLITVLISYAAVNIKGLRTRANISHHNILVRPHQVKAEALKAFDRVRVRFIHVILAKL